MRLAQWAGGTEGSGIDLYPCLNFPPNVSGSIPDKAVATIQFYYIFEMLGHFDKRIENQFFYLSSAAYLH